MARRDADDLYSLDEYWVPALLPEMESIWGAHPIFKTELMELCYSAFLTTYYDSTEDDHRTRRNVQRAFLAGAENGTGMFSAKSLKKYGKTMPTRSFVQKVLGNLCDPTFTRAPARIWTGDDAKDAAWAKAYTEARVNERLQEAYRRAAMSNIAALRPYHDRRGRKRIQVLPRDMFRVISADGDYADQVWVPHTETVIDGRRRMTFQVWTDDEMFFADYKGQRIPSDDPEYGINPYGRIPFVFLRLRESPNRDFYGGGWHDLATIQVFNNAIQLAESRNAVFNSFKTLIGINLGIEKRGLKIAPDEILDLNNVSAGSSDETGGLLPPQIDSLSLEGSYKTMQEWRTAVVREFMSNEGIPRHFYEEFVSPASGVALQVMEREPVRMRKAHYTPLQGAELDLAEMCALVWNTDREAPATGTERLDESLPDFSVTYADEPIYLEPAAAYELDKTQLADGVLYPSEFFRRYSGWNKPLTDDQAVAEMRRNKAMLSDPMPEAPIPASETAQNTETIQSPAPAENLTTGPQQS